MLPSERPHVAARSKGASVADLFTAHDADWDRFAASTEAAAALRRWRLRHPRLASFADVGALLTAIGDRRRPDTQDELLLALLAEARDDNVAGRAVLRAITPGLVRVVRSYRSVWGDSDTAAMVAAAALERIATYPLHRTRAVAANLIGDVRNHLHRARVRDQASLAVTPLPLDIAAPSEPTPGEEIIDLVEHAVAEGALTRRAGRLILLHHVFDVHGPALARIDGGGYEAVKKYRRRGEAALGSLAAPEVA